MRLLNRDNQRFRLPTSVALRPLFFADILGMDAAGQNVRDQHIGKRASLRAKLQHDTRAGIQARKNGANGIVLDRKAGNQKRLTRLRHHLQATLQRGKCGDIPVVRFGKRRQPRPVHLEKRFQPAVSEDTLQKIGRLCRRRCQVQFIGEQENIFRVDLREGNTNLEVRADAASPGGLWVEREHLDLRPEILLQTAHLTASVFHGPAPTVLAVHVEDKNRRLARLNDAAQADTGQKRFAGSRLSKNARRAFNKPVQI